MKKIPHRSLEIDLEKIRTHSPVVLNLTNYVAMDLNANALLAVGAAPIMAHALAELPDLVKIADAVVVNIGTLDESWSRSFLRAAELAKENNKPLVLDPVGAGASALRTHYAREILATRAVTVVRGNASEIAALFGETSNARGVDSSLRSDQAIDIARAAAKKWNLTVVVSGATDFIFSPAEEGRVENGDPLMTRVTAMGCTASALTGAFLAIASSPFQAALNAMGMMGVCGELAKTKSAGPGSFRMHFIDELSSVGPNELKRLRTAIS